MGTADQVPERRARGLHAILVSAVGVQQNYLLM